MPRGNAQIVEVIYTAKGGECFIVLVDSLEDYQAWKKDESIPLAQVVSGFKVFTAHKYVSRPLFLYLFCYCPSC
jgi:hypothetical protein